ncbi:glycosyltransferase [Kamptonema formosum]|uniref:glycosyltransferase n=1 Tax=Kamptonema formosum TaxID=331992 RepID=UPI000346BA39|nr:glycosyltransferase [Oscillatoria sp. PCC 10802]
MSRKPAAIIYWDHLLRTWETFVKSQGEELQSFVPYYVGSRRVLGLPLPEERTLVVNKGGLAGKVAEILFKVWGIAPSFYRDLRQIQPALIHAHTGGGATWAFPISQFLGIPMIVTFHGFYATVKDEYARKSFYVHQVYLRRREVLKREVRLFIAVSEFIKTKLLEQGFPPEKIRVHYIGVDLEKFKPDPAVPREPFVLFVGRLVERKGCDYLIRAMTRVQAVMPEIELVVIGEGSQRSALEKMAARSLQRYRFLGAQSPAAVKTWMNRAKVFSVPSVTVESGDCEAFGMVFAESQAMGLPAVSFASGGIPEAVRHGETGFLAAERDSQELAAYILRLLEDPTLWQQFSHNGKQRVHTLFNLQSQTRILEDIYGAVFREGV